MIIGTIMAVFMLVVARHYTAKTNKDLGLFDIMLILFDGKPRNNLLLLETIKKQAITEFCHISIEFIKRGANPKSYATASQKLGLDVTHVQQCVEGLMYLFCEAAKHKITADDLHNSVQSLGFDSEVIAQLVAVHKEHCGEIRALLQQTNIGLPVYEDLQWRFDVQVSSRSCHHQIEPSVTLKLNTTENAPRTVEHPAERIPQRTTRLLSADVNNLMHLTQQLDNALQTVKTQHCRKIMRNT